MAGLDLAEAKTKKMNTLEDLALDTVIDVFKNIEQADSDKVKIASKSLAVIAKNRQTLTNRAAIEFSMASSVATPEQLQKYITVTQPTIRKALQGKVDRK